MTSSRIKLTCIKGEIAVNHQVHQRLEDALEKLLVGKQARILPKFWNGQLHGNSHKNISGEVREISSATAWDGDIVLCLVRQKYSNYVESYQACIHLDEVAILWGQDGEAKTTE